MLIERLKTVILSIYLYNERQGYMQLEKLHDAFKASYPHETEMATAILKHAADEKKHFSMFNNYFHRAGKEPLKIGRSYGYVDQIVLALFGKSIDKIDQQEILKDEKLFFKLLRGIMITEERGLKQVHWLLRRRFIKNDPLLKSIFSVIAEDEPSHFLPYKNWLEKNQAGLVTWKERAADFWVHSTLVAFKIPLLLIQSLIGQAIS